MVYISYRQENISLLRGELGDEGAEVGGVGRIGRGGSAGVFIVRGGNFGRKSAKVTGRETLLEMRRIML